MTNLIGWKRNICRENRPRLNAAADMGIIMEKGATVLTGTGTDIMAGIMVDMSAVVADIMEGMSMKVTDGLHHRLHRLITATGIGQGRRRRPIPIMGMNMANGHLLLLLPLITIIITISTMNPGIMRKSSFMVRHPQDSRRKRKSRFSGNTAYSWRQP